MGVPVTSLPDRGDTDSTISPSVGRAGGDASGLPRIVFHVPEVTSALGDLYTSGPVALVARSCHGTPTIPSMYTIDGSRTVPSLETNSGLSTRSGFPSPFASGQPVVGSRATFDVQSDV